MIQPVVRLEKINSFHHFEWRYECDVIRNIKSPENPGVLIEGVSETVKHDIKKQEGAILGILLGTLGASVLKNMLTVKSFLRTGKGVVISGRRYNNMDKFFKFCSILEATLRFLTVSNRSQGLMVLFQEIFM